MNTVLILSFICCIGAQNITQPKRFQTSKLGDNVTIECYLPNTDYNHIVWYKQEIGSQLQAISKSYIYLTKVDFLGDYNDGRFKITLNKGIYHLHIYLTKKEDVATYFCGVITLGELYFGPGTFLILQDEKTAAEVRQVPISDKVRTGDNITFTCRVQKADGTCEAGQRVFWFREAADGSRPGVFYSDGGMKKSCEADLETQSCIYTFTKTNLSLSDAGVYYCAVLGCDKIMFGNGTSLKISSEHDSKLTRPLFLILVSSNIIAVLVMILLVAVQCTDGNRSSVCFNRSCDQEITEGAQVGIADASTYTSVSFSSKSRPSGGGEQHGISQHTDVYSQIRRSQSNS